MEFLEQNVLYNFSVSARNNFGNGPKSVPVPAKTKEEGMKIKLRLKSLLWE